MAGTIKWGGNVVNRNLLLDFKNGDDCIPILPVRDDGCSVSGLLVGRNAVVGSDNLPPAVYVHPDIRETVAVFVGFTLGYTFFVIRTGDNSRVPVHSNIQTRHFCNLYVEGRGPIVRDVSRFAKCTPVFCGDDEVVSQQRFHGRNIPTLIRRIPFVLECKNFGRCTVWLALRGRRMESPNCECCKDKKGNPDFHTSAHFLAFHQRTQQW